MTDTDESSYSERRMAMLVVVAAHAALSAEATGRSEISESVLNAMMEVPRHEFVAEHYRLRAYEDCPVPIGYEKTVSQPFIVALMLELLDIQSNERVLEIGTGLGYQAAVLSRIAAEVCTVDIIQELADDAVGRLGALEYSNVRVRVADGSFGWSEYAPYDKIIVAASSEYVPPALLDQLKSGGRLIMPVGPESDQELVLIEKNAAGTTKEEILPVRFSRLVVAH